MGLNKETKNKLPPLEKEDFIKFIASSTPNDINEFIHRYGKKPKLMVPIIYFE